MYGHTCMRTVEELVNNCTVDPAIYQRTYPACTVYDYTDCDNDDFSIAPIDDSEWENIENAIRNL